MGTHFSLFGVRYHFMGKLSMPFILKLNLGEEPVGVIASKISSMKSKLSVAANQIPPMHPGR